MTLTLTVIGFGLIALWDLLPLIRRKEWSGMVAFLLVFLPALTLAVLNRLNVEVPSVLEYVEKAMQTMGISF